MHLSAVKLLLLLCACFLFTLHFTPHPPHSISFLSALSIWFFPPFLFSHFDSSASHSYHSSVSFSFMLFLFLHSLSTLSKSGSLHGRSMLQFQFLLNLFTVLFILSWSLSFFFLSFVPCYFLYIRYLVQFVRADSLSESYQQSHCHSYRQLKYRRLRTCLISSVSFSRTSILDWD